MKNKEEVKVYRIEESKDFSWMIIFFFRFVLERVLIVSKGGVIEFFFKS